MDLQDKRGALSRLGPGRPALRLGARARTPLLAACQETSAPASRGSAAALPSFDAGGGQSGLNLHPSGFGAHSYAARKAHQGEPDGGGNADQALYFQKMTVTANFAAGVAVVDGLEGQRPSALDSLSWEHRTDGHCGAGAPRWNLALTDPDGAHTVFLGCAAAAHSPGGAPGWVKDSYTHSFIADAITLAELDTLTATISGLAIVFDEGTDVGPGFVFLDNITVNATVWTSPADNSN